MDILLLRHSAGFEHSYLPDAEVALSFARARLHDLGSNLHRSNALFYNALTHHGYAMRRCPEAENARARA